MGRYLIRQITACLAIGLVVTLLTVCATAVWIARSHDEQAAESTRTMVVGGLSSTRNRLASITNDYVWWDEAYQAYVRKDREWLDANIGSGITGTQIADALIILSPHGEIDYDWQLEDIHYPPDDIVPPTAVERLLALIRDLPVDRRAAQTLFLMTKGGVAMVGVARITPFEHLDSVKKEQMPILLMIQYLNKERLDELGGRFLLRDLHWQDHPSTPDRTLPLVAQDGISAGYLTWTPPTPGIAQLRGAAPLLGLALVIFCAAMLGIGLRARAMALALSRSEAQAQAVARFDPLTHLLNRFGFNELLDIAEIQEGLAVIYMDVNSFKAVNDTVGHHGGDALIREIAERFTDVLPDGAHLGRIGGDEFAVLLHRNDAKEAPTVALALMQALDAPFMVRGFEFHVSCSAGYAIAERKDVSAEELVRHADMAMYEAKRTGQREPCGYKPSMESHAAEKKQFEETLRRGLAAGELSVVYQPIARTRDLEIVSLEALIRWDSPVLGKVSPAELIAVAEETGFIHTIGSFVLERVCEDIARWPELRVSVNVSPVQLRDPDFTRNFTAMLKKHKVRPAQIDVELTEGVLIGDPAGAARKLAQLRKMGVSISLDDFGTGFSSIGYLRNFAFDHLKIDRSFVAEMDNSPQGRMMIHSVISLSAAMNLPVIAEGVETIEQIQVLHGVGCDYIQGYVLHAPAPPAVIQNFLRTHRAGAQLTEPATGSLG